MIHPWFNWADNALSDLGALGTPHNYIFNIGIILTGIIGLLFTLNIYKIMNTKIGKLGQFLFGLGLVFLILVGIFPSGTSPHNLVAISFFLFSTLGIVVVGVDQLFSKHTREWGLSLMFIITLGLTSLLLITTIPYDLDAAIPEAIGVIVFSEFSLGFGYRLLEL